MKYRVILQARTSSKRLKAKSMLTFYGNPLFVTCFKRVEDFCLDTVICTSTDHTDDPIADICKNLSIKLFRGDLNDVLLRFYNCSLDMEEDDTIIRLTCDNPLPCSNFLREMSRIWEDKEIDYLGAEEKSNNIPKGLSAEFFKVKYLRIANQQSKNSFDREHVTPYIKKNYSDEYLSNDFLDKHVSKSFSIDTFEDYLSVFKIMKGYDVNNLKLSYEEFLYE